MVCGIWYMVYFSSKKMISLCFIKFLLVLRIIGSGYLVKFASLFDVDENVVIGSSAASSDKGNSIKEYGTLDEVGQKLLKKRSEGKLIDSFIRESDQYTFYQYEFENPLDPSLPRFTNKCNVCFHFTYDINLNLGQAVGMPKRCRTI